MRDLFLTFKIFPDREAAQDFAEILKQHDIPYFIEEDALTFDPSYAHNDFLNKDYRLKIGQQHFNQAHMVLAAYYQQQLDKIDKDYYLFDFTDEELQDIIAKPDEWGPFDYQLAQKLLADKGKVIHTQQAEALRNKRIQELALPENVQNSTIVLAYMLCFFFFPVGLLMGWNWAYGKKTLPDGKRVPQYDGYAQKQGKIIFVIGLTFMALSILWRVVEMSDFGY